VMDGPVPSSFKRSAPRCCILYTARLRLNEGAAAPIASHRLAACGRLAALQHAHRRQLPSARPVSYCNPACCSPCCSVSCELWNCSDPQARTGRGRCRLALGVMWPGQPCRPRACCAVKCSCRPVWSPHRLLYCVFETRGLSSCLTAGYSAARLSTSAPPFIGLLQPDPAAQSL
jgi:hypothetical protein